MATKHVVGISGGIDSQACGRWVLNRYGPEDTIFINSQAGKNEHPLTVEHVEWISENVHPVIEVLPLFRDLGVSREGSNIFERRKGHDDDSEMTFEDIAVIKGGFPSRRAQWCTEYLKLRPQARWLKETLTDNDIHFVRYAGTRRDESEKRKNIPFTQWDGYVDCELQSPIADWTKAMCFDYCKAHGEKVNPLYELGFSRVGCAPCVNSGKEDVLQWATRFPEMVDKIRGWEATVGKPFFPPCVPGMETNYVDDVVKWSKTVRGGRRVALPFAQAEADSGACVSKYGLCG